MSSGDSSNAARLKARDVVASRATPPPPPIAWAPRSGALHAVHAGAGTAGRIVFVHGFTQTGASWRTIAEHFVRQGYEALLVDLPGHGGSEHVRADLRRTADLVATVGERATYVGYSLGGRVCLHLALMYPHLVERLALMGAHPGLDSESERSARRDADDRAAERIRTLGVPSFVREWVAQPLFGRLVATADDLADRERNTVEGLVSSLQLAGTGTQLSLWPRLRELTMDVLAMAGADDAKFAPIAAQIATAVPRGRCELVPDASHAAHLERPGYVEALLDDFMPSR